MRRVPGNFASASSESDALRHSPGPRATVNTVTSASSMMIHFSMYFISIDCPVLTEMRALRDEGGKGWDGEQWWYSTNSHTCGTSYRGRLPTQVLLGLAAYLGLCLVCTFGTPVADMQAYLPHLTSPSSSITLLKMTSSLQRIKKEYSLHFMQRVRLHRIRLRMPFSILQIFRSPTRGQAYDRDTF